MIYMISFGNLFELSNKLMRFALERSNLSQRRIFCEIFAVLEKVFPHPLDDPS